MYTAKKFEDEWWIYSPGKFCICKVASKIQADILLSHLNRDI